MEPGPTPGAGDVSLSLFAFMILLFAAFEFTRLASDAAGFIGTGSGICVLYSVVAVIINVVCNRRR